MTFIDTLEKEIETVHNNAKSKGWWENPRTDASIYALFHTEISEAVEEARKPVLSMEKMDMYYIQDWSHEGGGKLPVHGAVWNGDVCVAKPEGIGVELVDMVIRVLDYIGYHTDGKELKLPRDGVKAEDNGDFEDLSYFTDMHAYLSNAYGYRKHEMYEEELEHLLKSIDTVKIYFEKMGWDFWEVYRAKLSYNTTRSKRHGGKKF